MAAVAAVAAAAGVNVLYAATVDHAIQAQRQGGREAGSPPLPLVPACNSSTRLLH